MPHLQVKKVVALCLAEAAKLTLDHLGAHRLESSQQGMSGGNDLTRLYGEVRRLRDLLQRSVNAFHDLIDLELPAADAQLLVACCRRAVEAIEVRVRTQRVTAEEKQLLQRKPGVMGSSK